MNKFKCIALSLMFGLSSIGANAELISTDWKIESDSLATLDTTSGLEWLDLTQTKGMSYDQATGLLSSTFLGWRLPTSAEISTLYDNGIGAPYTSGVIGIGTSDSNFIQSEIFSSMLGETDYSGSTTSHYGLFFNEENASLNFMGINRANLTGSAARTNVLFTPLNSGSYESYSQYDSMGIYLVSDGGTTLSSINDPSLNENNPNAPINNAASVPLPATALLMGLGLMGTLRRKNKE